MLPAIEGNHMAQRIIETKFKSNKEVINYFTMPFMYIAYLKNVEAFNISYEPQIKFGEKIKFPQKIVYDNYPKIDFFPYTLPKTKVIQIWNKDKSTFTGDIKTDYLHLKVSILPFIDNGIKLLFVAEIIKKEIFVPKKILNFIIKDFERIFHIISEECLKNV